LGIEVDVRDHEAVEAYPAAARLMSDWTAAIAAAVARSGGLDILVNNAGLFLGKGVEEASLDE
jgi:NAD(P)-dependent dehydrogenase (short-subunit alcohol dehydrogenase family)